LASLRKFKNAFFITITALVLIAAATWTSPDRLAALFDLLGIETRQFVTLPLFTIGKLPVTFAFLIKTGVFLVFLIFVSNRVRAVLYSGIRRHTALGEQRGYILARFGSLAVFAIGLTIGLESVGLNLSTLTILGGTLGIGIGFGLQSVVANWVAGLVLLIEEPVRIGDRVDVGDTSGVVARIGGRSTWIRTYSNEVIIVPNSNLTNNLLTNWTANDPKVRLAIPVGVGYNSDPPQVRQLLLQIAGNHPEVLHEPAPEVIFKDLGASSLDFLLRFWTIVRDRDNYGLISDLYFAIFQTFREHGIEMPFTQQDLHLRSADVPIIIRTEASSSVQNAVDQLHRTLGNEKV
jgi:small-conductance mechanosensitive channel